MKTLFRITSYNMTKYKFVPNLKWSITILLLNSAYLIYIMFSFTITNQIAESQWIGFYVGILHLFEDPQSSLDIFLQTFQKSLEKEWAIWNRFHIFI